MARTPYLGSQLSQLCFSALETFDIWADHWVYFVAAFSAAAPQLREVSFSTSDPSWAKLPWNQITPLDLLHCTPSLEVLKEAPNLEMLLFCAPDSDNDSDEFSDA
jgi:hypothetical protein